MKRLMVALTLLAGFSMAAQAEEKTLDKTADFENRKLGAFSVKEYDDESVDPRPLWSRVDPKTGTTLEGEAATGESTVEKYADAPTADNKQYLHIDESNVLTRSLADPATISQYGYVKVASTVQFTAQDDDTTPTIVDGSKLAMWLKRTEETVAEVTTTNYALMVRAQKLEDELVITNYEFKVDGLAENTWYDLEVKAVRPGLYTGFIIKISGEKIGEVTLNKDDEPFLSLTQTGDYKAKIASIGFQGVGAVDDLVFSSEEGEEPEPTIDIKVTVDPEEAAFAMEDLPTYQFDAGEPVEFDPAIGFSFKASEIEKSVTICATAVEYEDYEKTYTKQEFLDLKGQLTITMTPSEPGEGPVTPPTGGGSVEEDPENPGTYIAAGDPTTHQVTIVSGLKDTDTILVKDSTIVAVNGVPPEQIKVELNGHKVDNSIFVGGNKTSFSLELNPEGAAKDGTPVRPTLTDDTPFEVGTDAAVSVKAIPGLKYALLRGEELTKIATTVVEATVAEESEITLTDKTEKKDKAFYKVQVTK